MNEHNVRGWAFLCCFLLIIFSLAAFAMVDYIRNPTAEASDIYFPDVQHVECKFDYNWNRSGYPMKKLECDITK